MTEIILDIKPWICSGIAFTEHGDSLNIYKKYKRRSITVPSIIHIDENFAWAIGFFLAEGTKCDYAVGASNCEIHLLERFQEFAQEYLKIKKSRWFIYVKTNSDVNDAKIRWMKYFKTERVVVSYTRLANVDNIEIRLNSMALAHVFSIIISHALNYIILDRNLILSFLDGYEVGDGSIIQRNGFLYGIVITVKDEKVKNTLINAFERLYGIKPRVRITKDVYEIGISNILMMTKIILDGHFRSSPRQWNKLIRGYLKKEYVRSHIRYWELIANREMTVQKLAQTAKRSHWAVRDAMKKDEQLHLIRVIRRRIPGKAGQPMVFFVLTDKCYQLLNILWSVRDEISEKQA